MRILSLVSIITVLSALTGCSAISFHRLTAEEEMCEEALKRKLYQPNTYYRVSGFMNGAPNAAPDAKKLVWNFKEKNIYGFEIDNQASCSLWKRDFVENGEPVPTNDFRVWSVEKIL